MIFINRSTALTSRTLKKTKARQQFNLFQMYSALEPTNLSSLVAAKFTFPLITEVSTIEICLCSLHRKEAFTGLRKKEKIDRSPHEPSQKERAAIFLMCFM